VNYRIDREALVESRQDFQPATLGLGGRLASARTGSSSLARAGKGQLADIWPPIPLSRSLSDKTGDLQELLNGP
jgi:hypothetical protein